MKTTKIKASKRGEVEQADEQQDAPTGTGAGTEEQCAAPQAASGRSGAAASGRAGADEDLNFSFACGGWLQNYLYGVAKCLQDCGLDDQIACCAGTSAGALTAAGLVLNADFDAIMESVITDYIAECHGTWQGPYQVKKYMHDCLAKHGNAHDFKKANGKLQINITALPDPLKMQPNIRRICKQQFDSEQELLTSLLASSCATPLAGLPMRLDKEHGDLAQTLVMDGGLAAFQPNVYTKNAASKGVTVNVNPLWFSGADIKPSIYIPVWWLIYPPSPKIYRATYDLGYADAIGWLRKQKCDSVEGSVFSLLDLAPCEQELQRRRDENGDWLDIITGGRRQLDTPSSFMDLCSPFMPTYGIGSDADAGNSDSNSNSSSSSSSNRRMGADAAGFVSRFIGYGDFSKRRSRFSEWLYVMLLFAVLLVAPICYMLVYCELALRTVTRCMGFGDISISLMGEISTEKPKERSLWECFALLCSPALLTSMWESCVRAVCSPMVVKAHLSPRVSGKKSNNGKVEEKAAERDAFLREKAPSSMGQLLGSLQQHSAVYRLSRHILHMPESGFA